MTGTSKLTLSSEELQLVNDTSWILTKRNIMEKAALMLGEQAAFLQDAVKGAALPGIVPATSPKIARGENYLQLPWLMLDYPRLFDRENIFAIRTMFWWGNFFSITLQLSGSYKKMYESKLVSGVSKMKTGLFICTAADEWQHHFENDNYTAAEHLSQEEISAVLQQKKFIKLAYKIPLQQWNEMPLLLQHHSMALLKLLNDQLPMR
ncbi:MAG: hypothetical protein U0V75_08995 [Ferruginibacter sp.]